MSSHCATSISPCRSRSTSATSSRTRTRAARRRSAAVRRRAIATMPCCASYGFGEAFVSTRGLGLREPRRPTSRTRLQARTADDSARSEHRPERRYPAADRDLVRAQRHRDPLRLGRGQGLPAEAPRTLEAARARRRPARLRSVGDPPRWRARLVDDGRIVTVYGLHGVPALRLHARSVDQARRRRRGIAARRSARPRRRRFRSRSQAEYLALGEATRAAGDEQRPAPGRTGARAATSPLIGQLARARPQDRERATSRCAPGIARSRTSCST